MAGQTEVWANAGDDTCEVLIAQETAQQISAQLNAATISITDDATGDTRTLNTADIIRVTPLIDSSADLPTTHGAGG
jgi:hypothetical protein